MSAIFSIIVPIYKVEPYVHKCIDSIVDQSYEDFELILVDDGSPDNCPKICDEYADRDKRIHVIHKKNGGLVSARNAGLKAATGEYVLYVDGDDWLLPDSLKRVYGKALNGCSPDMIVFNMTRVFDYGEVKDPCAVKEGLYDRAKLENDIYPYMMYDSRQGFYHWLLFPSCGGKIIRRTILLEHYCQDERIRMGEDNAFIFECMLESQSVYFLTEYFYMYNQQNAGSIRSNYDARRFENNKYLTDYMTEHLKGINAEVDRQFNVFKAYWLIMAVFHEVKCGRPLLKSSKHIKESVKKYKILENINFHELPIEAKLYIALLKAHCYVGALLAAREIEFIRGLKNKGINNG